MSKMGLHHPFGHLKHKLWSKERSRIKLAVWLPPNFLTCRWCATYCWKALDEGYNFVLDLISIGGLHTKLWGPKVTGVPTLELSRFSFGSFGIKCHLNVGLMERHKIYYKGEGGGFPQVRALVNLVSPSLPVARLSIKSAQTMH